MEQLDGRESVEIPPLFDGGDVPVRQPANLLEAARFIGICLGSKQIDFAECDRTSLEELARHASAHAKSNPKMESPDDMPGFDSMGAVGPFWLSNVGQNVANLAGFETFLQGKDR